MDDFLGFYGWRPDIVYHIYTGQDLYAKFNSTEFNNVSGDVWYEWEWDYACHLMRHKD